MSSGGNLNDLFKGWTNRDWMVVAGGLVAFIFSLFDYVGVSLGGFGSYTIGAWHSYAILGMFLILAAAATWALLATKAITLPPLPAKWEYISAAATGLGTLLIIIRAATYPSPIGIRFGGIVLIIAGFVMTAGALWATVAGSALNNASGPRTSRNNPWARGQSGGGQPPTPGGFPSPSVPPVSPPQDTPPPASPPFPPAPPQ